MSDLETESEKILLAVIAFLNAVYEVEADIWGDPVSALLIRRIAQGELEGRPFDVSSLAAALRMPTPTVSRRVVNLIDEGWVERRRLGRSYQLLMTDRVREAVKPRLAEVKRAARRFAGQVDGSNSGA